MLRQLSAAQLAGWRDYYAIEPWGDNLLDLRLAGVQRDFVNSKRDPAKRPEPYQLQDFCPYLEQSSSTIDLGSEQNAMLIKQQIKAMRRL